MDKYERKRQLETIVKGLLDGIYGPSQHFPEKPVEDTTPAVHPEPPKKRYLDSKKVSQEVREAYERVRAIQAADEAAAVVYGVTDATPIARHDLELVASIPHDSLRDELAQLQAADFYADFF